MNGERHSTPLEERVVRTLQDRGLLRHEGGSSGSGPRWRAPAQLAAALALLLLGGTLGAMLGPRLLGIPSRTAASERPNDAPRFMLVLYDTADGASVRDMGTWARGLQRRGHYVTGEKLAPSRVLVSPRGTEVGEAVMTGFFVVSAANEMEAESIGRA